MDKKDDIYLLITRELTGSISDAEKSALNQKASTDKQFAGKWKQFKRIWKLGYVTEDKKAVANIYENVISRIFEISLKRQKRINSGLKVAASLLLIISTSLLYLLNQESEIVNTKRYSTTIGETKEITLPDNSKVILNASSILFLPESFSDRSRDVVLIGEAQFKVEKNKKKPFRVETSHVEIEVLGTEFTLTAYQNEETITTYLKEGSVRINGEFEDRASYTMVPKQKVVVDKETMNLKVISDLEDSKKWVDGYLNFEKKPLSAILPRLERQFGIQFIVQDEEVNEYIYTGSFKDETVFEILGFLSITKPFKYELKNNHIIISKD